MTTADFRTILFSRKIERLRTHLYRHPNDWQAQVVLDFLQQLILP